MKPKVLFITHNCNFVNNFLIPQINLYKELGYQVDLASSLDLDQPPKEIDSFYDVKLKQSPKKFLSHFKSIKAIRSILKDRDYQIVNMHTPMGGIVGRIASIKKGVETLYTAHGFHFFKGSSKLSWLLFYPIEKFFSRFTDKLILINKEDFELALLKKFKAKKIYHVKGVGVEQPILNYNTIKDIKKKYQLESKDLVTISIGQLNQNKNHQLIIEAISLLKVDYPNIKHFILGSGPLENELNNSIKSKSLESNVHLIGYTNLVNEFLECSDILISASKREGLPKNVMEALILGKPCCVSNVRGNNELIQDKVNGTMFSEFDASQLKDAIRRIMSDYSRMSEEAKKLIDSYKIENVIQQYHEIFLEKVK